MEDRSGSYRRVVRPRGSSSMELDRVLVTNRCVLSPDACPVTSAVQRLLAECREALGTLLDHVDPTLRDARDGARAGTSGIGFRIVDTAAPRVSVALRTVADPRSFNCGRSRAGDVSPRLEWLAHVQTRQRSASMALCHLSEHVPSDAERAASARGEQRRRCGCLAGGSGTCTCC